MTTLNDIPGPRFKPIEEPPWPERLEKVRKPRLWLALVTGLAAPLAVVALGAGVWTVFTLIYRVRNENAAWDTDYFWNWMFSDNRYAWFMLIYLVLVQGAFMLLAVAPAAMSRERFVKRLGFGPGASSAPAIVLFALSAVFVATAGGYAAEIVFRIPDDAFEHHGWMFYQTTPIMLIALFVATTTLPAIAEETLFRGYVQRRLLQRWPAWLAIGVTAVLFAAMHADVYHALSVLVCGVWLGIIAWRADSIWPAVAGHFAINATWFVYSLLYMNGHEDIAVLLSWFILSLTFVAFVGAIVLLVRMPKRETEPRPQGSE